MKEESDPEVVNIPFERGIYTGNVVNGVPNGLGVTNLVISRG